MRNPNILNACIEEKAELSLETNTRLPRISRNMATSQDYDVYNVYKLIWQTVWKLYNIHFQWHQSWASFEKTPQFLERGIKRIVKRTEYDC